MARMVFGNWTNCEIPRRSQVRHVRGENGRTVCGVSDRAGLYVVPATPNNIANVSCKRCKQRLTERES